MNVHDVPAIAGSLNALDLAKRPTREEAMASALLLGRFNQCEARIASFAGQPPWEKHPDDELIHVLDGSVDVTLLDQDEPRVVTLARGALIVIPAGTWHRSRAADPVTVLVVTSAEGNERSMADDPRAGD